MLSISLMLPLMTVAQTISHRADSLMKLIPTLSGEEQLRAWQTLIDYDEVYFDPKWGPQIAEQFIEACHLQRNVYREVYARQVRMYMAYNNNALERARKFFTDDSLFLASHQCWDDLFVEWAQLPEIMVSVQKITEAEAMVKQIYDEATNWENKTGRGMAAYEFGNLYNALGNDSLAVEWYRHATELLSNGSNYTAYHYAAGQLVNKLGDQKRSAEKNQIMTLWRQALERSYKNGEGEMSRGTYDFYIFDIGLEEAYADIKTGNLNHAEQLLKQVEPLRIARVKGNSSNLSYGWGQLYMARKQWQQAYDKIQESLALTDEGVDEYEKLPRRMAIAECLMHMGRHEEASQALYTYARTSDSLRSQKLTYQLSEMQSVFELDELKATNQLTRQRSRFINGGLVLVFVVVGLVGFLSVNNRWRRRLEIKNMQLRRERNVVVAQNKQLEVERDRAEAASKAKTSFMQSMTHEIRTPLNAINGFTQVLLADGYDLPIEQRNDYSQRIEQNTTQLTNILDDLIQISDLESSTDALETSNYPAVVICEQAIAAVRPRVANGVSLHNACGVAADTLITTHPQLLLAALSKILNNAAKFTREGYITLSLTDSPEKLCFSVSDTGPGIPADKVDYIFERFTKLDSFAQGTGLGLNVARMIAERLGGTLTLDTSYIGGAKFDLIIPKV